MSCVLPRGMLGRDVELGEVEIVGLDVGPFGDREAHVAEDLGHLVPHLADRMDARRPARAEPHRQRDVGLLGGEPAPSSAFARAPAFAPSSASADAVLQPVDRLRRTPCARSAGILPSVRHQLGDAALLAERIDAHVFERAQIAARRRSRRGAWLRASADQCRVIGRHRVDTHSRGAAQPLARRRHDRRCPECRAPALDPYGHPGMGRNFAGRNPRDELGASAARRLLDQSALKPAASLTAMSASTLRSTSMPALVEAVDKSPVGQAVLAHGRVDALDPQRAEGALLAACGRGSRTAAPSRPPAWRCGWCSCAGRNSPWRSSGLSCAWHGR